MRFALICAFLIMAQAPQTAQAAQIFPPENEHECRPGSILSWGGGGQNVRCTDPRGVVTSDPRAIPDVIICNYDFGPRTMIYKGTEYGNYWYGMVGETGYHVAFTPEGEPVPYMRRLGSSAAHTDCRELTLRQLNATNRTFSIGGLANTEHLFVN